MKQQRKLLMKHEAMNAIRHLSWKMLIVVARATLARAQRSMLTTSIRPKARTAACMPSLLESSRSTKVPSPSLAVEEASSVLCAAA
jgi:hypothetical protein